ncbi:MAG TPA: hypothetical protein VJ600_08620 [Holophagaceae bacterium]|nr:hypothetical protein [Holophagaceae bacterium]
MKIVARVNYIGWVHLWHRREDFESGEPSAHFFNGKTDPLWKESESSRTPEQKALLAAGKLAEIEDPGYLASED